VIYRDEWSPSCPSHFTLHNEYSTVETHKILVGWRITMPKFKPETPNYKCRQHHYTNLFGQKLCPMCCNPDFTMHRAEWLTHSSWKSCTALISLVIICPENVWGIFSLCMPFCVKFWTKWPNIIAPSFCLLHSPLPVYECGKIPTQELLTWQALKPMERWHIYFT